MTRENLSPTEDVIVTQPIRLALFLQSLLLNGYSFSPYQRILFVTFFFFMSKVFNSHLDSSSLDSFTRILTSWLLDGSR